MRIAGKLIGALIGFIIFRNPFGLLLGALVGHFYDVAAAQLRPPSMGRGFIEPLFAFAGALSKSDGRVSEVEIAAAESLMARLRLDGAQRRAAIERFNAGKQTGFAVHLAIAELKSWCSGRRDLAFLVLDLLLDLVYAEGALVEAKLTLVRKLCWALGVSDHELAALSAMKGYAQAGPRGPGARPQAGPMRVDAYAVLGLERGADERDIKRAYRKLMSQHHPDKLGDVPDELKRRAEDRAREINAAYERIKTERGFK
ncbi:MAG TPA: co-chaperone DjlA [Rhodanobacteraceae bacterium]|nr:co-chaperone DjlA [Rhodanobacteraceae bacterium]